jgi:hypothetical protein
VRWDRYDVVKTLFHHGLQTLVDRGGGGHPYVVSKLGSVVAAEDRPDVYFTGTRREELFALQQEAVRRSRWVTVLSEPSRALWTESFGDRGNLLLVPGAADVALPPPGPDPFPADGVPRCLFAGNVYDAASQPDAHARLVSSLNRLGHELRRRGIRLCWIGPGDDRAVDRAAVDCAGPVPYERSWDYMRHARVGVVLALGDRPNVNESSKIYHYLRIGLPTVSEAGFPNEGLIAEAGLGVVVPNGDMTAMAEAVAEAASRSWPREQAVQFILARHTWPARAAVYDAVFARDLRR